MSPSSALRRCRAQSIKLLQNGTLKIYPGLPHGMLTVNAAELNADLLAFVKA